MVVVMVVYYQIVNMKVFAKDVSQFSEVQRISGSGSSHLKVLLASAQVSQ